MSYVSDVNERLKYELSANINLLTKANSRLVQSFELCSEIIKKENFTEEDYLILDSLTSRFARLSDIYTQKTLRLIFELLNEYPNTFIDKANFAEKLQLIESAERLSEIRMLRNDIAHEYEESDLQLLFVRVLKLVPSMTSIINSTLAYIHRKFEIKTTDN
ncbi:MAG: hypothetical protein IPP32_09790 [Bacteroidetes bacterium]|nr:hypothetical protein [Bacteroidota bacterium]